MADVIRKATNRFTKGLIMDFSPENTKNEVLTNALNATLLTFNGNELSLQNDMGNGRVETAYLPDGYMPVGTCEYGGIIYIVSYNPLEDKSQIGCFPSPERNISNDEIGLPEVSIKRNLFQKFTENSPIVPTGEIINNTQFVLLKNDNLNPGDKFIICSEKEILNEKLADLWIEEDPKHNSGREGYHLIDNPIIALNIVSIEDSGKIVYLNGDVVQYEEYNTYKTSENEEITDKYRYHISPKMLENAGVLSKTDLDSYRNVLNSGYSVFKSKTSGKLAILAELIMVDSYSVTHSIIPRKNVADEIIEGAFDIVIHTDVEPVVTQSNYNQVAKLQYYYLRNSQGYLQVDPIDTISTEKYRTLFEINKGINTGKPNASFGNTYLSEIYTPIDESLKYIEEENSPQLRDISKFNFPKPNTYHGTIQLFEDNLTGTSNKDYYTKFTEGKMHHIDIRQIKNNESSIDFPVVDNLTYFYEELQAQFFYYNKNASAEEKWTEGTLSKDYIYYTKKETNTYTDVKRDVDYKDHILYKIDSQPITATEIEIKDIQIEKFQQQTIESYVPITHADIANYETVYEKDGNSYKSLVGDPKDGVQYYKKVLKQELVSIGFEPSTETYKGTIYYFPGTEQYREATQEEKDLYYNTDLYPPESNAPYGAPFSLFYITKSSVNVEATQNELENWKELGIELYYTPQYVKLKDYNAVLAFSKKSNKEPLFIMMPIDIYLDVSKFQPNINVNYIHGQNQSITFNPKGDPLFVYTVTNFIPKKTPSNSDLIIPGETYNTYKDLKLANITLPSVVVNNGLDIPFKYDYTIVPCMNYGRLEHLAVSNTIDFSKLHAFNQSNFNTWKYRIDNNQLKLTFGVDVYDTYETYKVDGLIIEFYDLWGFAGSLEIVDKKSYSGIFTKIIPLNSLKALSRKKVEGNTQIETYKRNINLIPTGEKQGKFEKDEKIYTWKSSIEGFDFPIPSSENEMQDLNDCGTLYSNLLYGVKTYLRRQVKKDGRMVTEFIPKKEYFLYTLPIYNEYYYTTDDFTNLTYPELEFVLTYKLKDTSTKDPYTNDSNIIDGYNSVDTKNIDEYLGGYYEPKSLDLIKYYQYTGQTDLYLEIGLKKEYEDLNLSYHPDINKLFRSNLWLYSDNDQKSTYSVKSELDGDTIGSQILNYGTNIENLSVNELGFIDPKSKSCVQSYSIINGIKNCNFITDNGPEPIPINYKFIVGYTINISDIKSTQVPATTVCALFHKNDQQQFNYEDFSIQEYIDTENKTHLTSALMFYNEGTGEKEVFGLCSLTNPLDTTMTKQLSIVTTVETDAQQIKTAGKLNAGDPLRQVVDKFGKLTFCVPHAHGFSTENGVNVHEGSKGGSDYVIPPYVSGVKIGSSDDDTYGIAPRSYLHDHPIYNMSLLTLDSVRYQQFFYSTVHYKELEDKSIWLVNVDNDGDPYDGQGEWYQVDKAREFVGMTGQQLLTYNTKLVETMKSIYAYNPDYDSLTVNKGNVLLQKNNPSFSSHLVNTNSILSFNEGDSLNNYIYFGSIKISDYIQGINKFSQNQDGKNGIVVSNNEGVLPQISFKENLDYCGTENNNYLITSLTYNTPVPNEIEQELEFSASNITVVKQWDGSNFFLKGQPNKKALYAYNSNYKKMIQLDVSNYTINNDGVLTLNNEGPKVNIDKTFDLTQVDPKTLFNGGYSQKFSIGSEENPVEVTVNIRANLYTAQLLNSSTASEGCFIGCQHSTTNPGNFIVDFDAYIASSDTKSTYSVKLNKINFKADVVLLNDKVSIYGNPNPLSEQTFETLKTLSKKQGGNYVTFANNNQILNQELWAYPQAQTTMRVNNEYVRTKDYLDEDLHWLDNQIQLSSSGDLRFVYDLGPMAVSYNYLIGLIRLVFNNITITISKSDKLEHVPETFVSVVRTSQYSDKYSKEYKVLDEYKNTCIKGTSITINDLIYEPNNEVHRLFMRNGLCTYNPYLRGRLYYRPTAKEFKSQWSPKRNPAMEFTNNLYLFTGPCFTPDTLE